MSRRSKLMHMQFPLGGMNRKLAYQQQPPFTTVDCGNVRPVGFVKDRHRGGSRPGLSKVTVAAIGSGNPVRMLTSMRVVGAELETWRDDFDGSALSDVWAVVASASWDALWTDAVPLLVDRGFARQNGFTVNSAAVRDALDMVQSLVYTVSVSKQDAFDPKVGNALFASRFIFLMMDDGTPNPYNEGVVIRIRQATPGNSMVEYSGGSPVAGPPDITSVSESASLLVRVDENAQTVTLYADGVQVGQLTGVTIAGKGSRIGLGTDFVSGIAPHFDWVSVSYSPSTTNRSARDVVVTSSNGLIYREGDDGEMVVESVTPTLSANAELQTADRAQELFIADYEVRAAAADGAATATSFDSASYVDWRLVAEAGDKLIIESGGGTVVAGTYSITVAAEGTLTIGADVGTGTGCVFRVVRSPKVYDPIAGTLTVLTATAGIAPLECPLVCRYRDRLVWAGDNIWYMSRQGNGYDYDYSTDYEDVGRAVAGSTSEAGLVGYNHTALIPVGENLLILGCRNSLWVMRGDPAYGGSIINLSQIIGIIGQNAWCHGPNGEMLFLSDDGLYGMEPGSEMAPKSLSREAMPRELRDIDTATYTVTMAYDVRDRGVHIYLTANNAVAGIWHFWFDWTNKTFWPVTLQTDHEPTALMAHRSASALEDTVLLGCRDGFLRRYSANNADDDGSEIESYVIYGPFRLGSDDYYEGIIHEMIATIAEGSGDIKWSLLTGTSAEAVLDETARFTGTWIEKDHGGRQYAARPRARGGAFALKLQNGVTAAPFKGWAIDTLIARVKAAGKQRMR